MSTIIPEVGMPVEASSAGCDFGNQGLVEHMKVSVVYPDTKRFSLAYEDGSYANDAFRNRPYSELIKVGNKILFNRDLTNS